MQGVFRSPDVLLASRFVSGEEYQPGLFLLSGPSGAGKTSWCQRLVAGAREEGHRITGLLSPPVIEAGRKVGIEMLNVSTGERGRLASRREVSQDRGEGPVTGEWQFHSETLDWGNQILDRLRFEGLSKIDLVVLDELGPLEMQRGQGLQAGLDLIDAWFRDGKPGGQMLVVVRPALVPLARARWSVGQVLQVGVGGGDDLG